MNKNLYLIIAVIVLLLIGVGVYQNAKKGQSKPVATPQAMQSTQPIATASASASAIKETSNAQDFFNTLQPGESQQLLANAKAYVAKNSVPGMQFTLNFKKQVGDYVRFEVIPQNVQTDRAQVIMQKVNGQWKAIDFGTDFPERYQSMPDLFKD